MKSTQSFGIWRRVVWELRNQYHEGTSCLQLEDDILKNEAADAPERLVPVVHITRRHIPADRSSVNMERNLYRFHFNTVQTDTLFHLPYGISSLDSECISCFPLFPVLRHHLKLQYKRAVHKETELFFLNLLLYLQLNQTCLLRSNPLHSWYTAPNVFSSSGTRRGTCFAGWREGPLSNFLVSSTIWNRRPFSEDFNFGNKKMSAGAKSGE